MRKVKNITVCVTPEIYRQTRHLAAEYDTTVSTIVAWLLQRLPAALERTHFPKGGPKSPSQPYPAVDNVVTPYPHFPGSEVEADRETPLPTSYSPVRALKIIEKIIANSGCKTVPPPLTSEFSTACSQSSDPVTVPVQL